VSSTPEEDNDERRIGGRYRLSSQLGAGAMGTVWSAFDEVLQRRVAVKELKVPRGIPEREAASMRERMLREARALGGLSHPNVITVYDVVDVEGEPVVVLEMVPSRNLATIIDDQGSLTDRQAAVVGFATAAALRAAHRSGITHRDVKPANVLVADDGRVKLTDFGIARNAADAPMTTAGLVLGSPAYMAPEVAAGQPVTPAADLWGLGATLFAAIEGRPPYDVRGDPVATLTEVVDGEVPRPRSSSAVADVVSALMIKDPAHRMSLEQVRARLRPLIDDPDDPLYPGSPDTPTTGAPAVVRPVGPPPAPAEQSPAPAAPLAPAPGPLPGRPAAPPRPAPPRPHRPTRPRAPDPTSGRAAAGLIAAGAVVVLLGAAGGWSVTRLLAGQSPLSTVTVTTDRAELAAHVDPLGFTAQVPVGWVPYRFEPPGGPSSVSFVSPDGSEELTVWRAASQEAVTDALTPELLGVDSVRPGTKELLPDGSSQVVYRTQEGSLSRTSWLRLIPTDGEIWVMRLTVPSGHGEDASAQLAGALAERFAPAAT
jgi:serine/threonine protein kinase